MERVEILSRINRINQKISNLQSNKRKYSNMNVKLENAISKLKKSEENIVNSYKELAKNYSSNESSKKVKNLQDEYNNVKKIRKELSDKVLSESKEKIRKINNQISQLEREKQQLRNQLK